MGMDRIWLNLGAIGEFTSLRKRDKLNGHLARTPKKDDDAKDAHDVHHSEKPTVRSHKNYFFCSVIFCFLISHTANVMLIASVKPISKTTHVITTP